MLPLHKAKVMAFRKKYPVRTMKRDNEQDIRQDVNRSILEQISIFKYLGCEMSSEVDCDVKTFNKVKNICGKFHRILKYKTRKHTKLKFCLLYTSY